MREALGNPLGGFYAAHGATAIAAPGAAGTVRGHFVTAPEISVLFAEVRCTAPRRRIVLRSRPRSAVYWETGT